MESPEILEGMAIRSHNHRWGIRQLAEGPELEVSVSFLEVALRLYMPAGFLLALVYIYRRKLKEFFRWLKGSRTSYYLSTTPGYEEVYTTHPLWKLRTESQRMAFYKRKMGSIIEINRGPFRRRSAIYGPAAKNWKIAKVSKGCNAQGGFGADWVDLVDCSSLPIERALYFINKYPSLQELMIENGKQHNWIAELERKLSAVELELQTAKDNLFYTNERREEWNAGVTAVLRVIERDRQYFRSQAAQNIREGLETLVKWQKDHAEPEADPNDIQRWDNAFHRSVYY